MQCVFHSIAPLDDGSVFPPPPSDLLTNGGGGVVVGPAASPIPSPPRPTTLKLDFSAKPHSRQCKVAGMKAFWKRDRRKAAGEQRSQGEQQQQQQQRPSSGSRRRLRRESNGTSIKK